MSKNLMLVVLLLVGTWARLVAQAPPNAMTVIHVTGKVTAADGKPVALRQVIATTDKLTFGNAQSGLVAWEPTAGLIALQPKAAGGNTKPVLAGAASGFGSKIMLAAHPERLERFASVAQLKQHFDGRKYLLLGKSWLLAPRQLQGTSDTVLVIKYRNLTEDYQSGNKVPASNDTLHLDPKTLFALNGKPIDPAQLSDFSLLWVKKSTNTSGQIASFRLVVADEERIHAAIALLLELMKDKQAAEQLAAARSLVEHVWGEPDSHNFTVWMRQHFPELSVETKRPRGGR